MGIALAKRLLRERQLGMEQVTERVGYGSASTFTVAFARHAGMAPARYARMSRALRTVVAQQYDRMAQC